MFWKPPCYCLDHPFYPFRPFLVFSPGPRHPLSGGFKWPLHFTLPPRSNALASVVFLTQVKLWELRTISVFGVGRSDAWSYGPLPSLITWEYRLLVSPVSGTIDQVSPQCAGGWSRGSAVAVSPQFSVFQRAPPHSSQWLPDALHLLQSRWRRCRPSNSGVECECAVKPAPILSHDCGVHLFLPIQCHFFD